MCILIRLYIYYIIHNVCNSLKTLSQSYLSPKIIMLTKTDIYSVQNYFKGNTDRQKFENDKQKVDLAPPGKTSADARE